MAVNSLFLIMKAKLPAISLHHQERKKLIQNFLCIGSNSPWLKLVFVLPGNDKDHEKEFLLNKNIIRNQCHFANSTESFRFLTENYA